MRSSIAAHRVIVWLVATAAAATSAQEPVDDVFDGEAPWLRRESAVERSFAEHLETDRDSFTPATTVVGRRRVLAETSYSFLDNRSTPDTHSFPELLTRIGLTERTELRLGWNYEAGGGGTVSGSDINAEEEVADVETEARMLYGFKTVVTEQCRWRPVSAVIVQGVTPTAGEGTDTHVVAGYVAGWTFRDDWKLDAGLRFGTASEEEDRFQNWAPSIVLRVPVRERWNVHAEYFGIFTQDRADELNVQYFSPGVHYLISSDCEIGVRVGWGLTEDAANFFSNVGLGVRF